MLTIQFSQISELYTYTIYLEKQTNIENRFNSCRQNNNRID